MTTMNKHCCEQMERLLEEGRVIVTYIPAFREYGMLLNNKNFEKINHCPWCGSKLLDSLQDKWFEELKKLGFDNPLQQAIPAAFKDDTWWQQLNKK